MAKQPEPFSTKATDPEAAREKVVSTPDTTFDERTVNARPLWMNEDGSQNTGEEDLERPENTSEVEGAEGSETRSETATREAGAESKETPATKKASAKK